VTSPVFDLPERLAAKADPALIADDERRFAAIASAVRRQLAELEERLDEVRLRTGDNNQEVLERDLEAHELSSRIRLLRRFGLDVCLGRMVAEGDAEPIYIGRLSLADADGTRLLVDWRAPAAEPFFAATHGDPMGLVSRRRYRWNRGHITDYWDEVFTADGLEHSAALDDQSAFIASLGASRSPQMRDVLATIQSDQDAIIRASSRGPLIVDGGPAPASRSWRCTAPPTCSTPTRASAIAAAACCSWARTSPTSPTWPTCCRASARRGCRPARCATSSSRAPQQGWRRMPKPRA
jgi:hypothetical protein